MTDKIIEDNHSPPDSSKNTVVCSKGDTSNSKEITEELAGEELK